MALYDREHPPDKGDAIEYADQIVSEATVWPPMSLGFIIARLDLLREWGVMDAIEYNRVRNGAENWATA